jgi:hypothetical protein
LRSAVGPGALAWAEEMAKVNKRVRRRFFMVQGLLVGKSVIKN